MVCVFTVYGVKLGLSSATEGNVQETKNILLRIIIVVRKKK